MFKYTASSPKSKASPAAVKSSSPSTIPDYIGGPPDTGSSVTATKNLMINSGLQVSIQPCVPKSQTGLSLFILDSQQAWDEYVKLLKDVNFQTSELQNQSKSITIVCQAENYPTDSFQNDYGESFLNQLTDVAAGGLGQLAQMSGNRDATSTMKDMGTMMKEGSESFGGMFGNFMSALGGGIESAGAGAHQKAKEWEKAGGLKGTIGSTMNQLLAGARVDFPMIWKGSSYSPTFSCSLKLYNPNPGSEESTKKYIVAPLAALLTLALPQSKEVNSYNYPFFCKVDCPGLFKIHAGAISNITIVKGGDAGLVGFNQRVSIVDVRMDFVNLHSTLLLSKNGIDTRPTLKGYLDNMLDEFKLEPIYGEESGASSAGQSLSSLVSNAASVSSDLSDPPPSRIDTIRRTIENGLRNLDKSGFYPG